MNFSSQSGSNPIRLAAVQAASVFLDRDASLEKACTIVKEAASHGANIIAFPEGFIPGHPVWFHFRPASDRDSLALAARLSENALELEGREIARLCSLAAEYAVFLVMGCCERAPARPGTLYNTLVFISPDGQVVGRHRKLIPTLGEQIVHAAGDAAGLRTYEFRSGGHVSGLMCGENSNALATFALDAQAANIHVAAWPPFFQMGADLPDIIRMVSRGLAYQMKAFIINSAGAVSEEMCRDLPITDEQREFMRTRSGGACVIGPWGQVLTEDLGPGEGIAYADASLKDITVPKIVHDFGGRYNRFDLLRLDLSRGSYGPVLVSGQSMTTGRALDSQADTVDGAGHEPSLAIGSPGDDEDAAKAHLAIGYE